MKLFLIRIIVNQLMGRRHNGENYFQTNIFEKLKLVKGNNIRQTVWNFLFSHDRHDSYWWHLGIAII
jgi:hypothetical protein